MTATVYLAAALLCFGSTCHPVLVGKDTPLGEYELIERRVADPLYGSSVLQFLETTDTVYAIHRPWLGNPKENRLERLSSLRTKDRVITRGCVNVHEDLYLKLKSSLPIRLSIKP